MPAAVYVDSEGAVKAWVNANATLTGGSSPPLGQGAHLKRLTPFRRTYAYLLLIATTTGMTAETPVVIARISATIYGATKALSEIGARAYANELAAIQRAAVPVAMGPVVCVAVDNITGPTPIDDTETSREQFRYLVDADYLMSG